WQARRDGHGQGARQNRRSPVPGLVLAATGLAATALTVLVVLPSFNPTGGFDYWQQMDGNGHPSAGSLAARLVWPPVKWLLLFLLAATAGFLGLRSPLILLCVPTLAWRLLSANPNYWGVSYHYSAVLMPIVIAALIDVVRRSDRRRIRRALAVSALVTAVTLPLYPLHEAVMPEAWRTPPRLTETRAMLDLIPDDATVASSNRLAAQLTHRAVVTLVCRPPVGPAPEWVAVDLRDPTVQSPCAIAVTRRMVAEYRERGYRPLIDQDDLLLLKRP
ncbi:DUF2079 domain-containing protein, partial [Kitasatospora sp. NPDC093558]|uniref:DUF2079 domain-containing protein n=1 Tax=Kitasatospora sp. NPDC093558 TaxID=3155201 RepID=UPI0034190C55